MEKDGEERKMDKEEMEIDKEEMETNEQGKMSVNHVMAKTRYIRFARNFIV